MPSLPVPEVLHIIVRRPYSDVSGVYHWLQENSVRSLCGQHEADDEIANTHCHIQVKKFGKTAQSIRDKLKIAGLAGRGNYNILTETQRTKKPYDEDALNIYIIKGIISNHKESTYTPQQIQAYAEAWVDHDSDPPVSTEKSIKKKKEKPQTHWDIIEEILQMAKSKPGWFDSVLDRDDQGYVITADNALSALGRSGIFDLMCQRLAHHKVRTSRNELERFYVTILRHDKSSRENLRESIMRNVFRNL